MVVRGRRNPFHFGLPARLKKARRDSGLSFDGVANRAGLTDGSTVLHLERKAAHIPRLNTVELIAYALGLSPTFLAYGIEADGLPLADGLRCEEVAVRLQETRAARGLSVLALAKQAGLSHTAVGNIERGTMPGIDTAEALAKALGVSPGWLAYGLGPMELPKRRTTRPAASTAPASAT
jgi:transcriptional regulator with XRE-family HTH domain